jgi:hypothetical protein
MTNSAATHVKVTDTIKKVLLETSAVDAPAADMATNESVLVRWSRTFGYNGVEQWKEGECGTVSQQGCGG